MTRITNDDLNKKILKHRTEEAMRLALHQFINQEHELHIPPDSEDADMVLSDVIEELLEARKKLAILEPLRNAWFSEHAWEEASRDPCGPEKVLEPVIRPLTPVEAPIHDAIKASAMISRKDAEKAANAELARYANPGYITNQGFIKENAMYFIDSGDCHGTENLEVLQKEQEA